MEHRSTYLIAGSLVGALMAATPAFATPVGLELSLLVDISSSINTREYNLQLAGYSDAFRSDAVREAIASNETGSIAVNMIMWSSGTRQAEVLPWTQVFDSTAMDFADLLDTIERPFTGNTGPQSALEYVATFENNINANDFESNRQVIDMSGDGTRNSGLRGTEGRDAAIAAGYDVINGITIGSSASLEAYYRENVQWGEGSFTLTATDFNDFGTAIAQKLELEISQPPSEVPVVATLPILMTGLGFLAMFRRRRAA